MIMKKGDTKYTRDGRKIVIIEVINSNEFVVREIFVKNNKEVPSGDKFVAKNLLDEPVLTWKQKENIKNEENAIRLKKSIEASNREITEIQQKVLANKAILNGTINNLKWFQDNSDKLEMLQNFLVGDIKWVVVGGGYSSISKPQDFIETITYHKDSYYDNPKRFEAIKLISLLGNNKGDLEFRLNQYSDGSGSFGSYVTFHETWDDAIKRIKERALEKIENDRLTKSDLETCIELGIQLPKTVLRKLYREYINDTKNHIKSLNKDREATIKKNETNLKELQKKLKSV